MTNLASLIDHTLLKPEAGADAYRKLVTEAIEHGFCCVCVPPSWIAFCRDAGGDAPPVIATVVGFPNGYATSESKAFETRDAVEHGATEIDMVIDVGRLKGGEFDVVRDDIRGVVDAAAGRAVKVILETALLTDDEKRRACELSEDAGAAFVKTSTGFASGGATVADIRLMHAMVGGRLGVKASGGIRTVDDARTMVDAGATRLGCSASVAIVGAG